MFLLISLLFSLLCDDDDWNGDEFIKDWLEMFRLDVVDNKDDDDDVNEEVNGDVFVVIVFDDDLWLLEEFRNEICWGDANGLRKRGGWDEVVNILLVDIDVDEEDVWFWCLSCFRKSYFSLWFWYFDKEDVDGCNVETNKERGWFVRLISDW